MVHIKALVKHEQVKPKSVYGKIIETKQEINQMEIKRQ